MAFLTLRTQRPDKDTNRAAWNRTWEEDLGKYGQLDIRRIISLPPPPPEVQQYGETMMPQAQLYFAGLTRDIHDLQRRIRECALARLVDGFEEKWKALSDSQRHAIALEGIYNTCSISTDMENHRKWCPDSTMHGLTGKNGQNYIKMIMAIVDNTDASSTELVFFSHPIVDILLRSATVRIIAPGVRLHRCYFLTTTIWKMFLAIHGETEPNPVIKTLHRSNIRVPHKLKRDALNALNLPPEGKAYLRGMAKDRPPIVSSCWNCGKIETGVGANKILKACSKCKDNGRNVRYCSGECQRHNWKHGKPPHKLTCGTDLLEYPESGAQQDSQKPSKIPKPEPPFKRSVPLQYQISLLESGKADYVIMRPVEDGSIAVVFPLERRVAFLVMRQRALKTGCPRAVAIMYGLLKSGAESFGVSEGVLRVQMEKEFGIPDLDLVDVTGAEEPTEKEIDEILTLIAPDEGSSISRRN